ncbi:MAG TPA: hypothetical protein VMB82_10235 [Acidimicrobiales bacterium]|nr:hypothetical protein [Acidimicrobiales bacterium]
MGSAARLVTGRRGAWGSATARRAGWSAAGLAALAIFLFVPGIQPGALAATGTPPNEVGAAGTDTALPVTSSAVTVSGRGSFAGLKLTVNQTQDLENQAISVSWTGGVPTDSGPGVPFDTTYSENYLQIFECWGTPSASDPLTAVNPGPAPTQCEFGGESSAESSAYPVQGSGFEYTRVLSPSTWSIYSTTTGWTDPATGFIIEPFDAVDGTVVDQQADYNWDDNPEDPSAFWLNPYFSYDDTNEVDFARTYADGTGQVLFQVDTGLEAPGLGCGQSVDAQSDGSTTIPDCWLVVVPRGTMAQENPSGLTGVNGVVTSPLDPQAWANRIAIPLEFKPVGGSCAIGADEERIVGSELATSAVSSWQPALCAQPGTPPYSYSYMSDDEARQDLTDPSYGSAGLAVFSDPIDPSQISASAPVVYAPLTLSGIVVGFNIDRQPALVDSGLYAGEEGLSGTRIENLYLTPLLVAKLLTESYQEELKDVVSDKSSSYGWVQHNPTSLVTDPDFLQYNPEFEDLSDRSGGLDAASLVVEESSSDAAVAVWNWVLSDPEARAWLAGQSTGEPAGDGTMLVNPVYSTNPAVNPTPFGSPTPETFPKEDPYCYSDPTAVVEPNGSKTEPARPLCIQDWSPYALTMSAAAQAAATSNDGGKTTLNPSQPPDAAWGANGPQESGESFILSITDSASAAQFGLQTASLSRAGDDGPDPTFVPADEQSILAGERAMQPSAVPGVMVTNPSPSSSSGYPLSLLTYAAATPDSLDATDRQDYATFLRYAAGPGQVSGVEAGQLPPGYVPLPSDLVDQAVSAAATILNPPSTVTPDSTTTTAAPVTPSAARVSPTPQTTEARPQASQGAVVEVPDEAAPAPTGASTTTSPRAPAPVPTQHARLSTATTGVFDVGALRWAVRVAVLGGLSLALVGLGADVVLRRRPRRQPGLAGATSGVWQPTGAGGAGPFDNHGRGAS